jgi:hypothetical protein
MYSEESNSIRMLGNEEDSSGRVTRICTNTFWKTRSVAHSLTEDERVVVIEISIDFPEGKEEEDDEEEEDRADRVFFFVRGTSLYR